MKPCPSCESTEGYRYWPDQDGNDPILTFEPPQPDQKEDGPGYVVIEHVMADVGWDFTTHIDCLECSESFRAGDVLEPEPVDYREYLAVMGSVRFSVENAQSRSFGGDLVAEIALAIDALIKAKNMAAKGFSN